MGRIVMREEEMEGAASAIDKCYTDGDSTAKQIPSKFSSVMSTGLVNTSINTITKQMNSLTTSMFNVKNIIKKHSTEMFNMDRNMSNIAESIEVPQDFVKNDSMQEKNFEEYMFSKVDGKSVNSGDAATANVDGNTNTTVTDEALSNINNNKGAQEVAFAGDTSVGIENLNDINQNTQTTQVNGDSNTSVISENLADVNNGEETKKVEASAETVVNGQNLNNISNNNGLREEQFTSGTSVQNEALKNMNLNGRMYANQSDSQVITKSSTANTTIRKPQNSEKENG